MTAARVKAGRLGGNAGTRAAARYAAWRADGVPTVVTAAEAFRLTDGAVGTEGDHATEWTLSAVARRAEAAATTARRTPIRTVRVDDELWAAATEAAANNGQSVSDVIRAALAAYVDAEAVGVRA